ncbi:MULTISPECIES: hypothetical protein [unclassified Streptomyces]|uniref:hypothetical protein n=1 Tax=unclassified Streptomyces TaxID=2593676 RepID=UPI000DC7D377|nr:MULTISPECIES: hypothetical protein [unclassified Streptomyces]AWZ06186.1 hypothetical protein DRB89_17910 [Streptomyces sp. ICC4]AWZ13808.1 hypothetical protein DRB96_17605 [Streptomyces sp. ICC1]
MEVPEEGTSVELEYEDHPLLHRQVRDPKTGREGQVMAVMRQTLGHTAGRRREALTAYVRPAGGGPEFTAAPDGLEPV